MNIFYQLLTKMNLEILAALAEQESSLRELAERVNCSPAKIHQAISLFKRDGLVTTKRLKNRLLILPDRKNPLYRRVKALINISKIINAKGYAPLKKIGLLGVYGSYAQGTDDKESDIDLLIVTDKKEMELRDAIRILEKELGKKINPLVKTRKQLGELEKEDKEFGIRLKLTTVELNGDLFE